MDGGVEFLGGICRMICSLLHVGGGEFHVLGLEAVIRYGNSNPYHQDMKTGFGAFSRDTKSDMIGTRQAPYGCRILIDLASESRNMVFRVGEAGAVLLASTSRIIAMNAGAAGSGGKGVVNHGRVGDGLAITLDIGLNELGRRNVRVHAGSNGSSSVFRNFGLTTAIRQGSSVPAPGFSRTFRLAGGVGVARTSSLDNKIASVAALGEVDRIVAGGGDQVDMNVLFSAARKAASNSYKAASTDYSGEAIDTAIELLLKRAVDLSSAMHCFLCLSHTAGVGSSRQSWLTIHIDGVDRRICKICLQRTMFTGKGKGNKGNKAKNGNRTPSREDPGYTIWACARCRTSPRDGARQILDEVDFVA